MSDFVRTGAATSVPFVGKVSLTLAENGKGALSFFRAPHLAPCTHGTVRQPAKPNSRAISMRWTSLVPSPISRILESRHMRATGYSFMNP